MSPARIRILLRKQVEYVVGVSHGGPVDRKRMAAFKSGLADHVERALMPEVELAIDDAVQTAVIDACAVYAERLQANDDDEVTLAAPQPGSPLMTVWLTGVLMAFQALAELYGVEVDLDDAEAVNDGQDLVDALLASIMQQCAALTRLVPS